MKSQQVIKVDDEITIRRAERSLIIGPVRMHSVAHWGVSDESYHRPHRDNGRCESSRRVRCWAFAWRDAKQCRSRSWGESRAGCAFTRN